METRYPTVLKAVIAILISSLFVFSTQTAKAQCNYTSGGNGVSMYATTPLVIDGNMNDWAPYLIDPDNNTYDNLVNDLDWPIADMGRDLARIAFTQNTSFLYVYISRVGSTTNKTDIVIYFDINNNDILDSFEPVVQLDWGGTNTNVNVSVHNYIPSVNANENSVSANLDGTMMGGSLSPRTNLGNIGVGSDDGISMEAAIPFSALTQLNAGGAVINQLQSGQNFKFHISTINGNVSSVPGVNSINDNFGGCIIAPTFNSLPLTLLNFDAALKTEKVNLSWTTTNHKDFSHFILQKSTNGRDFNDVMTMMTDATDFSAVHQYAYKDDVAGANGNVIYYRLQMVDANSTFEYSPIRMVRLNAVTAVQIQAFPNPVTSELRITIPISWQEKNVMYEIYNSNGSLINRVQKNNAVQIQQLNVSSLGSGNYIIRVTNGQEMSTTKFIKH